MNFTTFFALLMRDLHVARRNFVPLLLQTLVQPMLFVFVFGRIMTSGGFLPPEYKALLLPGIVAITMVFSGIQAVSMPLISELQFTREIEDRLLAPINAQWVAVEKVVAGMLQAVIAGAVVFPAAWLLMGSGIDLDAPRALALVGVGLLVAMLASAGGLALGSSVGPTHIGLMFSLVMAPLIFLGCTYYPWSALESFPILQRAVLINPIVYASEGLRSSLAPGFPHLPLPADVLALLGMDLLVMSIGIRQFMRKVVT